MFNRIYGIITTSLGVANPKRYSDVIATDKQRKVIKLLGISGDHDIELFTDFAIKLISCSPEWASVVREFDPNNSYDISVINSDELVDVLSFNPLNRLMEWSDKVPVSVRFPTSETDPVVDKTIHKLLGVLMDE